MLPPNPRNVCYALVSRGLAVDTRADGHGPIPDMALGEVKRQDAGVRFGERIATLAESLDWLAHNPLPPGRACAAMPPPPARVGRSQSGGLASRMVQSLSIVQVETT